MNLAKFIVSFLFHQFRGKFAEVAEKAGLVPQKLNLKTTRSEEKVQIKFQKGKISRFGQKNQDKQPNFKFIS